MASDPFNAGHRGGANTEGLDPHCCTDRSDSDPENWASSSDGACEDDDDSVGYKRPPKKHRFKPGQSGNPAGRRKGAKGLKTIVKRELSGRVRITENGRSLKINKMELMIKRLVEMGGKGNFQALAKIVDLGAVVFGMEDEEQAVPSLTREEQASSDEAAKRRRMLAAQTSTRSATTRRKSTTLPETNDSKGDRK